MLVSKIKLVPLASSSCVKSWNQMSPIVLKLTFQSQSHASKEHSALWKNSEHLWWKKKRHYPAFCSSSGKNPEKWTSFVCVSSYFQGATVALAQLGKLSSWNMATPHVLMPMLMVKTPTMFKMNPALAWKQRRNMFQQKRGKKFQGSVTFIIILSKLDTGLIFSYHGPICCSTVYHTMLLLLGPSH